MMGTPIAEAFMSVTRPQRILVLAPMYHINAFATLSSMLTGDQLYVLEKFDAARIVDVIERHRITTFTATPTMLQRMADLPGVDDRDLSSLEWIMQGAAPMPPVARAPVGGPDRRREDRHGVRVDRSPRSHRAHRARMDATRRERRSRASAVPRSASSTTTAHDVPTGEIGAHLRALARLRAARPTWVKRRSCT